MRAESQEDKSFHKSTIIDMLHKTKSPILPMIKEFADLSQQEEP